MCKLVQLVLCLQQRTLLIFRVNLAVKTIKVKNKKWTILCKFDRNIWYVLSKDFVPSPVEHCFKCSGIRTHRFCFLSHPSLPNKMIEPSKPRNALKLCFYFLLCISLTCQTLFFLKTVQKSRTCFCVLPASQANIWTGAQNDRILKKQTFTKFLDRFRMHG